MSSSETRPLAVVTGASSGIGFELAKVFAEHGFDLMITAEDERIVAARSALGELAEVDSLRVDLSTDRGVEALYHHIRAAARPVDALAVTAGGGRTVREGHLERELDLIDLNVRSAVHLYKLVVGEMIARNHGAILFAAPPSGNADPAIGEASRSFMRSFALASRDQLEDTDVAVGSTAEAELFAGEDPAELARQSVDALMAAPR